MVEQLLTVDDVCKILKISKKHLYNLMNEGKIKSINIGSNKSQSRGRPRFRTSDIQQLIDTL